MAKKTKVEKVIRILREVEVLQGCFRHQLLFL